MYKALVACRAGMGSSLMLKIKIAQVIDENKLPLTLEHGSLDSLPGFNGDLVITLIDVSKDIQGVNPKLDIIGINNIMDKTEILTKINTYLESKK